MRSNQVRNGLESSSASNAASVTCALVIARPPPKAKERGPGVKTTLPTSPWRPCSTPPKEIPSTTTREKPRRTDATRQGNPSRRLNSSSTRVFNHGRRAIAPTPNKTTTTPKIHSARRRLIDTRHQGAELAAVQPSPRPNTAPRGAQRRLRSSGDRPVPHGALARGPELGRRLSRPAYWGNAPRRSMTTPAVRIERSPPGSPGASRIHPTDDAWGPSRGPQLAARVSAA